MRAGWLWGVGRVLGWALLVLSGLGSAAPAQGPPIVVMSFNVLCQVCDLGTADPWRQRLGYMADILARHRPQLVGFQELAPGNVAQLQKLLPNHAAVWRHVDPDSTIFYDTRRFTLLDSGSYWLSQWPDSSPFPSWDFSGPRVVVFAVLHDRETERQLVFVNSHIDANDANQLPSLQLILSRLAPYAGLPVVFSCDCNSGPGEEPYEWLLNHSATLVPGLVLTDAQFAGVPQRFISNDPALVTACLLQYDDCAARDIDHIFLKGFAVHDFITDLWLYGDPPQWPSDHRPVVAAVSYAGP